METRDGEGLCFGWREWASLPALDLPAVKVKMDTGAKTSCLHTFDIQHFRRRHKEYVRFKVHPLQQNRHLWRRCTAPVVDRRRVSDSGGHREWRYVIETEIRMGVMRWPIEITLTNRDTMRFRMLLGRQAMPPGSCVYAGRSYLYGRCNAKREYGLD